MAWRKSIKLLRLRAAAEGRQRKYQRPFALRHPFKPAHYEPLEAVAAVGVFVFHQNPHHLREQQRHPFALADEIFLAAAAYDLVGEEGAAVFYYLRPAEGRERYFERAHAELRLYVAQHPLRRRGAFGARGHEYHGGYLQLGEEDAQRVEGFVVEPVQVLEYKDGLAAVAEALREQLALIRRRGWSIDDQEHEDDIMCIACPIRDYTGSVIAAMSVSFPLFRFNRADFEKTCERIVSVTGELSAIMGWEREAE